MGGNTYLPSNVKPAPLVGPPTFPHFEITFTGTCLTLEFF